MGKDSQRTDYNETLK